MKKNDSTCQSKLEAALEKQIKRITLSEDKFKIKYAKLSIKNKILEIQTSMQKQSLDFIQK